VLNFDIVLSHDVAVEVQITVDAVSTQGQMNAPVPQFAVGNLDGKPEFGTIAIGAIGMIIQPDFQEIAEDDKHIQLTKGSNLLAVTIFDDTEQECDEEFSVELHHLVCASGSTLCGTVVTIADSEAVGSLINDAEGVVISVSMDVEHDESYTPFMFEIAVSHAVDHEFEVDASIVSTPEALSRLAACQGLTFAQCEQATLQSYNVRMHQPQLALSPRTWHADYAVAVLNDRIAQAPGVFTVQLTSDYELLCGESLAHKSGTGTITDNENGVLEIVSFKAEEDKTAQHNMIVKLNRPIEFPLTVGYKIVGGTSDDFDKLKGRFTFPPRAGPQEVSIPLAVRADKDEIEEDETYTLELTSVPAWLTARSGTFTIIDDEIKGSDIVVSSATVLEGGVLEFEVSLEGGEHEAPITINVATEAGSAKRGRHFRPVQTQLRWETGQTQTQIIRVLTKVKNGCTPNVEMKLKLFNIVGPGRFENRNEVEYATGTILDTSSTTVSVHAPAFIVAGQSGIFKGTLSETCSFAVTVPVTIDGKSEQCTIPAKRSTCDIVVQTKKKHRKVIEAAVDTDKLAQENLDYGSLVDGTSKSTTVGKKTTNPKPVAAAYACGPLVSATSLTEGKVSLVAGNDFTTELDITACFINAQSIDYEVTGSVEVARTGGILSLTSPSAGPSTLTLTGTTADGATGVVTLELRANTKAPVSLADLAGGITMAVGDHYQALIAGVVNDDQIGNIDQCEISDGASGSLTDCCVVDDNLIAHTCERVVPGARTSRIESVRVNIQAIEEGTSSVCLGTFSDSTTPASHCFEVTVPEKLKLKAPDSVTANDGEIQIKLGKGSYTVLEVAGASSWSKKGRTLTASVPAGVTAVYVMASDSYDYVATAEVLVL